MTKKTTPRRKTLRASPVLHRVYWILEHYLAAIENDFQQKKPEPQDRERDARMIHALARTLEKLAALEQLLADQKPSQDGKLGDENIRSRLESRIADLLASQKQTILPPKSLR